jgi:hypothetical protein
LTDCKLDQCFGICARTVLLASVCSFSLVALSYRMYDQGFESQEGLGIFPLTTASRLALGPTQPPIQWIPGVLSPGIKQLVPGHEADHSPPSSAKVKNVWCYTSTPPVCFHGIVLN